eukprot:818601-Prymnesium_polylepis.2
MRCLVAHLVDGGHLRIDLLRVHEPLPLSVMLEKQRTILGDELPVVLPVGVIVLNQRALAALASQFALATHILLVPLFPQLDVVIVKCRCASTWIGAAQPPRPAQVRINVDC